MADIGYSNEELERLCRINSRFEMGVAPWASHLSESSSFGKTFREWASFPKWLPLYFCSEHGVSNMTKCWPSEIEGPYRIFLTWNKKKSDLMNKLYGKTAIHVPHPWVSYRKKHYSERSNSGVGTVVFYPHSNAGCTVVIPDLDDYISRLKALPDKFHPIVLCLSSFEVNEGVHLELRRYGLPIVTAGIINSQQFVDRFYEMLYRFKYATSPDIGSHTFYCLEAGIPFFLFGPAPESRMKRNSEWASEHSESTFSWKDNGDAEDYEIFNNIKRLVSSPVDCVTDEQRAIADEYLGVKSPVTGVDAAIIFWRELAFHSDKLFLSYSARIARKMFRLIFPSRNDAT